MVSDGDAVRVDAGWWEKLRDAVGGHGDVPFALVEEPVVVTAE